MDVWYLLLPLSFMASLIALAAFIWCVRHGQYEDLVRDGERPLREKE